MLIELHYARSGKPFLLNSNVIASVVEGDTGKISLPHSHIVTLTGDVYDVRETIARILRLDRCLTQDA